MRGRIIHYNGNDGKGLISADNKQFAFEIGHWQSESAPAINTMVDFDSDGDRPTAVRRITDEVLMREKASELAGKLSALGGAALQGAQGAASNAQLGNPVARVGKPALIAHGAFAIGALFLAFIKINSGFGPSQSFTLAGLSKLSEQMGMSAGSGLLVWMAILSLLVPMFWRSRFAWLALLLPLLATVKPAWDVRSAMGEITSTVSGLGQGMGSEFSGAMAKQISEMLDIGMGAYVCVIAALCLAAIAVKRFLLTPAT